MRMGKAAVVRSEMLELVEPLDFRLLDSVKNSQLCLHCWALDEARRVRSQSVVGENDVTDNFAESALKAVVADPIVGD